MKYREEGEDDWIDLDYGDDARETTIPKPTSNTQLASNTTYQVQVRAKNDEGEGPMGYGASAPLRERN